MTIADHTNGAIKARSDAAGGTEAATRVADVMLAFCGGPQYLGVSSIARQLGLSKAVVHRILQALMSRDFVLVDPVSRMYRLGPAAAIMGARALRDSDLRVAAQPVIRELREVTRETTTLSALVGNQRVYLDQVEGPQEIKMIVEVGRRFHLHAGSSSKSILAFLPPSVRDALLGERLQALTKSTIVNPDELRVELRQIRRAGVSVSRGERQSGAGSVAAPIFAIDGSVIGALSVCGPVDRFDQAAIERFQPLVREAADRVSRVLGWRGGLPERAPGD